MIENSEDTLERARNEADRTASESQGMALALIADARARAESVSLKSLDIAREAIAEAEAHTVDNTLITLVVALSYGARAEITQAARALASKVAAGELDPADIDEETLSNGLLTSGIPDPDLLIRTSGEKRISNFLLWQAAYSELIFVDTLWPDFSKEDFDAAIREFNGRDRRYGNITS